MKNMRKIAVLILTLAMVLSMVTVASAATVTVSQEGHTYKAYQILTGTQADTEGALGDVKWGDGINSAAFLTALKADPTVGSVFAKASTARDFAEALAELTDNSAGAKAVAEIADANKKGNGTTLKLGENTLADGYYLIVDATATDGKYDSKNASLLQVTRDIVIAEKAAKPSVDKQVHDEPADAESGHTDGWGESADHAMNESFQFKLIATLPVDEHFESYEKYTIKFNDTMSAGITFESIASVKVNGTPITEYTSTATAGMAGGTWSLTIADIKKYDANLTDGAVIEVIYNAHLNEAAAIGNVDTNKNTVNLEYSNNPNADGDGKLGKTPDDTVWVFTYEMDNKKVGEVDGVQSALKDAGFRLYSDEACQNEIAVVYDASLNGYRLAKAGETGVEMKSGEDGQFDVRGLDTGVYYLKESSTPPGYNTCDKVKIEITATHAEAASETTASTTIKMTQDGVDATENLIVNKAGVVLPETGGMGTTLFYILGGFMVLAAAVLLVTKKRMENIA